MLSPNIRNLTFGISAIASRGSAIPWFSIKNGVTEGNKVQVCRCVEWGRDER
jgi:hypothetical protein